MTGGDTCIAHAPNPDQALAKAADYLLKEKKIIDISYPGLKLEDIALKEKVFTTSNFGAATFRNVDFSGSRFRLCFLNGSVFENCTFRFCNFIYTVFSESTFHSCDFTGSDITHCNFMGIDGADTVFNDTDLYFSIFTGAKLREVTFIDCNVKKTDFYKSQRDGVNFKYSNYEEAIFQRRYLL
jgi:fluoroquinolone resistance protein